MKIVLDTNVLMSGIFFTGPPYRILDAWRKGTIQIVLSSEIIREYLRVSDELSGKYPAIDVQPIMELLVKNSEVIEAEGLPKQVCDDPDDDKFLAAAISGVAKIIVSGDRHLLKVSAYQSIIVLRPKAFVDRYL